MTGDIEKTAETALVTKAPLLIAADLVVIPHHGSLTSSRCRLSKRFHLNWHLFQAAIETGTAFPKRRWWPVGAPAEARLSIPQRAVP